jgi:transcriptional regulator with XRE-family HTH domain
MSEIKFGTKIKELRQVKKLTLKELSEKSKIGITYLSKIENNKTGIPAIETIDKLIAALNVNEETQEELFRLAKQLPPDIKDSVTKSKALFDVFRAAKDLNENELKGLVEEIERRKKSKHEDNKK